MKKGVGVIAICIVAMMVLTGCSHASLLDDVEESVKNYSEDFSEEEAIDGDRTEETVNGGYIKKEESLVGQVTSYYSVAKIGGVKLLFSQECQSSIVFNWDNSNEKKKIELPDGFFAFEVSSGEKNFYVYCDCINNNSNYSSLMIYDINGNLIKDCSLPFKRMIATNGFLYGYYDGGGCGYGNMNISQNCIEATHYIDEDEFLEKYPTKIEEWTKISGKEKVEIGEKTFYQCKSDVGHDVDYYRDAKLYPVDDQICYVLYCNGKCKSAENDKRVKPWLKQIYKLMDKKEKNFSIYTIQKGNDLYGICNVYKKSDGMLNQYTKDVKYSVSFQYDEKKDNLYRTGKYEGVDLFYADDENVLYHKLDGAYYKNLVTGEDKKVYDYDGGISVNVLDGYVTFYESVIHYGDETPDVFETMKLW